jgi:hypothetical protein
VRRAPIVFSVCQDDIIVYLDNTPFIASSRGDFMGFDPVTNRDQQQTELIHDPFGALVVLQMDTDTSECAHHKGQNSIDDKNIVEYLLVRLEWEHLDFDKTKSVTEVWGNDHRENESGCG